MSADGDGTCTHTFAVPDPDTEPGPEARIEKLVSADDLGVHDGAWHCPHDALDGYEKCPFHLPVADRPTDLDVTQAFLDHLERANERSDPTARRRHQQFIDATFDEFHLRGRVVGSGDRSYVDLRHATFYDVDCSRAEFAQRLRFAHCTFTTSDAHEPVVPSSPTFSAYSDIESILFKSVDFRFNVDFSWSTFDAPVRFHGIQCDRWTGFKGVAFRGPVDFMMAEFDRMASFWRTEFQGGARMSAAKFDAYAWFSDAHFGGDTRWYAARFRNDVDFDGATVSAPASFEAASFAYTADFGDVALDAPLDFHDVDADTLHVSPRIDGDVGVVDLSEAAVGDGTLDQPADGHVVYDVADAVLGTVRFHGDTDGPLLDWIRFHRTRYDGFDFSDADDLAPVAANYRLHDLGADARAALDDNWTPPTHDDAVTTYLYAKNASGEAGDSVAAGSFFYREMQYRRRTHWVRAFETDRPRTSRLYDLLQWTRSSVMSLTTGYGEHPDRVVYSSIAVILAFTALYASTDAVLGESSVGASLVFSIQSFVTLIFGDVPGGTTMATKLFGAVEGFLGAFFIALFVFTLTRRVHR